MIGRTITELIGMSGGLSNKRRVAPRLQSAVVIDDKEIDDTFLAIGFRAR